MRSNGLIETGRIIIPNRPSDFCGFGIRPGNSPLDAAIWADTPLGAGRRPKTGKAGQTSHFTITRTFQNLVGFHIPSLFILMNQHMGYSYVSATP
jgi:hypothetical protein